MAWDEDERRKVAVMMERKRKGPLSEQLKRTLAKPLVKFRDKKHRSGWEVDLKRRIAEAEAKEAAEAKAAAQARLNAPLSFGGRPRVLKEPTRLTPFNLAVRQLDWLDAKARDLKTSRVEVLRQVIDAAMTEVQP